MLRDSIVVVVVVVIVVVRTRPRAIPLAMIAMRKSTHGFPFVSRIWDAYGAPLGGPFRRPFGPPELRYEEAIFNPLTPRCLQTADYRLQTAYRGPQTVDYKETLTDCWPQILKTAELTTVFVDTRLWKTKHPRKRFQNFRQSCVLLTDRIEIHQLQPLA